MLRNCSISLLISKILYADMVDFIAPEASFFSLKCTKIVSGWGSAPDPTGGAYSAPPDPLAVQGREGRGEGIVPTSFCLGNEPCSYADDTQMHLSVPVSESSVAARWFSQCIEEIDGWMQMKRLKMNTDKTQLIWIGTRQQLSKIGINEIRLQLDTVYRSPRLCRTWA